MLKSTDSDEPYGMLVGGAFVGMAKAHFTKLSERA